MRVIRLPEEHEKDSDLRRCRQTRWNTNIPCYPAWSSRDSPSINSKEKFMFPGSLLSREPFSFVCGIVFNTCINQFRLLIRICREYTSSLSFTTKEVLWKARQYRARFSVPGTDVLFSCPPPYSKGLILVPLFIYR